MRSGCIPTNYYDTYFICVVYTSTGSSLPEKSAFATKHFNFEPSNGFPDARNPLEYVGVKSVKSNPTQSYCDDENLADRLSRHSLLTVIKRSSLNF